MISLRYHRKQKMSEDNRTMKCPQCGVENYSWRSRCQSCDALLHEEDNNINIGKFHNWDSLEVIAIISGVVGTGALALFMWLILAFASGHITDPLGWLVIIGTALFTLGSVVFARKWPLIGGILIVIEAFVPMGFIVSSIFMTHSVFNFMAIFFLLPGIPSLVSGIIFLFLSRER
jgi:hypothetical protein